MVATIVQWRHLGLLVKIVLDLTWRHMWKNMFEQTIKPYVMSLCRWMALS